MWFGQFFETNGDFYSRLITKAVFSKPAVGFPKFDAHDFAPPCDAITLGDRHFYFDAISDFGCGTSVDNESDSGFGEVDQQRVFDSTWADCVLETKTHVFAVLRTQDIAGSSLYEFSCAMVHTWM